MSEEKDVTGWKLSAEDRDVLLARFRPAYPNVIADHVTLNSEATAETSLPREVAAHVVGRADDEAGVECFVVEIDGTTDRPDGSTYHITWSLGPGRQAQESNDVLRDRGWRPLAKPVVIELEPARF